MLVRHRLDMPLDLLLEEVNPWRREGVCLERVLGTCQRGLKSGLASQGGSSGCCTRTGPASSESGDMHGGPASRGDSGSFL
jgi:hypothetical protein